MTRQVRNQLVTDTCAVLTVGQGTRAHWSPENTTMHLVRSINGVTFIDELELVSKRRAKLIARISTSFLCTVLSEYQKFVLWIQLLSVPSGYFLCLARLWLDGRGATRCSGICASPLFASIKPDRTR